jgi:hypothetical protein
VGIEQSSGGRGDCPIERGRGGWRSRGGSCTESRAFVLAMAPVKARSSHSQPAIHTPGGEMQTLSASPPDRPFLKPAPTRSGARPPAIARILPLAPAIACILLLPQQSFSRASNRTPSPARASNRTRLSLASAIARFVHLAPATAGHLSPAPAIALSLALAPRNRAHSPSRPSNRSHCRPGSSNSTPALSFADTQRAPCACPT